MIIIGIGNLYRSDDAVGPVVAAGLSARFGSDERVSIADLDGEPVRLMQTWEGHDHVVVVDAVRSGAPPGTLHRYTVEQLTERGPSESAVGVSIGGGHALGLGDAVDLARVLGRLPPRLDVIAVEGASFDLGQGLTPAVALACDRLVDELVELFGADDGPSADPRQQLTER